MSRPDWVAVAHRFEGQELTVRRLYASDPEFRSVCEDYATATRALASWEADRMRAEDYRQLVGELEAEIRSFLDAERDVRAERKLP
jgi:hypothetical protein